MIPLLLIILLGAVLVFIVWTIAVHTHGRKILPWTIEAKLARKIKAEEDLTKLIKDNREAEEARRTAFGDEWSRRFEGRD